MLQFGFSVESRHVLKRNTRLMLKVNLGGERRGKVDSRTSPKLKNDRSVADAIVCPCFVTFVGARNKSFEDEVATASIFSMCSRRCYLTPLSLRARERVCASPICGGRRALNSELRRFGE